MILIMGYKERKQNELQHFIVENIKGSVTLNDDVLFEITEDLDNIYENYIKNGGEMLYAYDVRKRKIVGTIALKFEDDISFLKRFYVAKEYRNKKIGYSLYRALERRILEKKISKSYLITGKELKTAHKFYERNGWIMQEQITGIRVRDGAFLYTREWNHNEI